MKNYIYLVLATILLTVSCTDENPSTADSKACFDFEPTAYVGIGDEITFTNCSEDANNYLWDFGDGNISTNENPSHSYENEGYFTISLIAANETSVDTISKDITVEASEITNYLSFNGEKYKLDWGVFGSVSEFEVDKSGRYHEILLMSEGVLANGEEDPTGTGNFINLTITTDASHVNNIIGDFSNYGNLSGSALDVDDYSWVGVGLETLDNNEWGMPYVDAESISTFTISKEADIYTISITGQGVRETKTGEENGSIELFYRGTLSQQ